MVSSRYHAERMSREATEALLKAIHRAGSASLAFVIDAVRKKYPKISDEQIRRRARSLAKKGWLNGSGRAGYQLTSSGHRYLEELSFGAIRFRGKWDGRWRVVIFDIPETERKSRNTIRNLLLVLGFRELQHSVWVHPLDCAKAFHKIRESYGTTDHIQLLEVVNFDIPRHIRTHFKKKYPALPI